MHKHALYVCCCYFPGSLGWHAVCVAGFWDSRQPHRRLKRRMWHWRWLRVGLASGHSQLMGLTLPLPQNGILTRLIPVFRGDSVLRLCSFEDPNWVSKNFAFGTFFTFIMIDCEVTLFFKATAIACLACLCTSGTVQVGLFMLPLVGRIRLMMFVTLLSVFVTCLLLFLDISHTVYLFPFNWGKVVSN